MYKKREKPIYLDDFNQLNEFEIDPNNQWLKKAEIIPLDEFEREYSSRFPSKVGQVAKSARLTLGALLVQKEDDDVFDCAVDNVAEPEQGSFFLFYFRSIFQAEYQ